LINNIAEPRNLFRLQMPRARRSRDTGTRHNCDNPRSQVTIDLVDWDVVKIGDIVIIIRYRPEKGGVD
jgi:hypothetical protein